MVDGPPDKIWSVRAWSQQMAWMSLKPRAMTHPYYLAAYEVWHNKVPKEDPFREDDFKASRNLSFGLRRTRPRVAWSPGGAVWPRIP